MTGIRNLVSIDDLSLAEVMELFHHARRFGEDLSAWSHLCRGQIMASLFYEPSTRTRLSFESAMLRLGGGVVTAADMKTSSAAKGESLADTVRVVGEGYADLLILRHSSEGAARLAVDNSTVPVINAGDGSHEHPTQTLCDLYTLWIEKGRLDGIDVVLAGDLRYSRTIHSFAYALARFGANIICIPHHGFEMPSYVLQRLREEFGAQPLRADASKLGEMAAESDAVYLTPQKPHQLSLFTDGRGLRVDRVDAVYMTRPQTERHTGTDDSSDGYLMLGEKGMASEPLRNALLMHPLPRRDEISQDFDKDPRAMSFKQAARGVPVRMAILAVLLGRLDLKARSENSEERRYEVIGGPNPCPNPTCISHTEIRHVKPTFKLSSRSPLKAVCGFCNQELPVAFVGCSTTRNFHTGDSSAARKIRPDHLVFFRDEREAESSGFVSSSR